MSGDGWCEVDDPFGTLFRDAVEVSESGGKVPVTVLTGAWEVYRNCRPVELPVWMVSHGLKLFRPGTAEHMLVQEAMSAAVAEHAGLQVADSAEVPVVMARAIWDDIESGLREHAPDWWLADA